MNSFFVQQEKPSLFSVVVVVSFVHPQHFTHPTVPLMRLRDTDRARLLDRLIRFPSGSIIFYCRFSLALTPACSFLSFASHISLSLCAAQNHSPDNRSETDTHGMMKTGVLNTYAYTHTHTHARKTCLASRSTPSSA